MVKDAGGLHDKCPGCWVFHDGLPIGPHSAIRASRHLRAKNVLNQIRDEKSQKVPEEPFVHVVGIMVVLKRN
jgi:hypothetical protein